MREFTRNNQPHFQSRETSYSLTFILFDAVTGPELETLRNELNEELRDIEHDLMDRKELRKAEARSRNFKRLEGLLHDKREQSHLLADADAAIAVSEYFKKFNGELYQLDCHSVMSNHAHAMLNLSPQLALYDGDKLPWPLDRLIGRLKGGSAHAANKALGRTGTLWMRGYHDRYIRSADHFTYAHDYIVRNPEKAGLVEDWRKHAGTWSRFK